MVILKKCLRLFVEFIMFCENTDLKQNKFYNPIIQKYFALIIHIIEKNLMM